jgi:hypothetical protein
MFTQTPARSGPTREVSPPGQSVFNRVPPQHCLIPSCNSQITHYGDGSDGSLLPEIFRTADPKPQPDTSHKSARYEFLLRDLISGTT